MTLDQAQRPIEVGAVALFVFFRPSRYVRRVDMIVPKFALDAICALTRAHAPRAQCLAIANVVDQAAFDGTVQGVFGRILVNMLALQTLAHLLTGIVVIAAQHHDAIERLLLRIDLVLGICLLCTVAL